MGPSVGDREGLTGVSRGIGRARNGHARDGEPPPAALMASRQISTVPALPPAVPPEVRNVMSLMLTRLNGPLSSIQSPALRPPRWSPPPTSAVAAVLVPDWLTANSTSCLFWRIWCCVDRCQGRNASRAAVIGVRRADHAEHVAAVRDVLGVRRQDAGAARHRRLGVAVGVVPRTKVTSTSAQLIAPSSGSLTVTENGMLSPKANVPPSTGVVRRHRWRRVADRDRRVRCADLPARVGDGQPATNTPRVVYVNVGLGRRSRPCRRRRSPTRSGSSRPDPDRSSPRWRD